MKCIINIPSAVPMVALTAAALVAAPATATPGSGFTPSPIVNGHFGVLSENTASNKTGSWGMILKTLDDTDIGADRLTLQPSGYSGWHAHPANVFVTVTQGTVTWYDGSDGLCTPHTYTAGQSFIERAYRIHNVRNASNSSTAEFVAIVIKPEGFVGPAFRLDKPEPNNCNF
jgi:quercetin dioxygenase-like cupin family protein